jgi:NTE family protein
MAEDPMLGTAGQKKGTQSIPKKINLALQGGGAHGAFAWGVLDQLCSDGRLLIDGLSACSAGSMNATVYCYGKMKGGLEGARKALHDFWFDISVEGAKYSPVKPTLWDRLFLGWGSIDESFSYLAFEGFTKIFSPYQFNPLNINPLKEVLQRHVNFSELQELSCTKLFICATNVRTNKIKVFNHREISVDAVMASACLPMLFQAVEINGQAYWDGGYMGNPALYPLVYNTETEDLVIVHINPIERKEIPKTAREIYNRINEISFNSSLLREMRAVEFAKRLVEDKMIKPEFRSHFKFNKLHMHSIRADAIMSEFHIASKFNPDWEFLCLLRDKGRACAAQWLDQNVDMIGNHSTIDLREVFE